MTAPEPGTYWQHWYTIVEDSRGLRQGDILRNLTVALLPGDLADLPQQPTATPTIRLDLALGDWIVLSASCDVDERKADGQVLLAHVLPTTEKTLGASGAKDLKEKQEVIRRGWDPTRFLLAPCLGITPELPLSFTQYRTQALMPLAYLRRQCATPRIRMKPPFREKFAVWAGAALARVGIEDAENIPPFVSSIYAAHILRAGET